MAWEYRDVTIPAHVQSKLADGKLSPTDLLIILAINSLTKHLDDGTGLGCYATNSYLATASHANSGNYVSERLRRLAKLGYVLIIEHEGKRYLELEWSRTAEEREELAGEYGDLLRTAHRLALKRIQKKAKGVTIDRNPLITINRKPPLTIDRNQSIRDNIKRKAKEGGSAAATPPSPSPPKLPLVNEDKPSAKKRFSDHLVNGNGSPAFCYEWHNRAVKALRSRAGVALKSVQAVKGAASFKKLFDSLGGDRNIVDRFLQAYEEHAGEITKPDIGSVHQLADPLVFNWVSRVMKENGWLETESDRRLVW